MATVLASNKNKIAKRVIEVFEFFDEHKRQATVMDIARRFGRPQSSTSELLSSLVEMGFLYKDARSRSYMPTPRVAMLGSSAQPDLLRNGHMLPLMDRIAQLTGLGVALMGVVGTHVQIFRWEAGRTPLSNELVCGTSEPLSSSVAGMLLLSTQSFDQSGGMLRRLNAEAPSARKFHHAEAMDKIRVFGRQRHAIGESGFVDGADMCAVLLPHQAGERPLALGVIYPAGNGTDPADLLAELQRTVVGCTQNAARTTEKSLYASLQCDDRSVEA
ncbi:helix-turn-helix domain-containing protein [uncultured Sphingomonas sp.]|uniref:helix-turn-helix domain-containing protein n=1 Tax=uncultured Sphingomonas sp. TaxID=158754 RepID=UPI0035CAFB1B